MFTVAWVNKDPELAGIVWMLDEIRTRLNQHHEVARLERNARRRARRRGEVVAPLPAGQSHGLLTRASVRDLSAAGTRPGPVRSVCRATAPASSA